ncbi:hypothetical protein K435DRAFT_803712 [Dendrothele bispora CBS 962.96]|uniref:FYVE-type domain-containing protein n=1 Tax=Dendrothele bispora (strain CBS 962.96) TaxID=1314807 RepID=A0A4S8LGQ5_DENBC|nr:hypothetical protein K435DRAFT_803712 [Dendrothele bispora CBS 962.96]
MSSGSDTASVLSAQSTASSSSLSSPALTVPPLLTAPEHLVPLRSNEHLAVLMPKRLWKSDSLASVCDSFYCPTRFSLLERRHHCRKCGGIFCHACSSHTTPLLDTSSLPFLHPPRNVPIAKYASPNSPVVISRVCDDCWDQLHGCPSTPRTPELTSVLPISVAGTRSRPLSPFASASSSPSSSSPNTPPNDALGLVVSPHLEHQRQHHHHHHSNQTSFPSSSSSSHSRAPSKDGSLNRSLSRSSGKRSSNPDLRRRVTVLRSAAATTTTTTTTSPTCPNSSSPHLPPSTGERSYGELDSYPLRRSSVLCKASGGGRWEPKQSTVLDGYRVPVLGGKAPFEVEMERQMEEERRRRENPVIRDGEFQLRFLSNRLVREEDEEVFEAGNGGKVQRSYSLSTF